jgi:hypothetical protein
MRRPRERLVGADVLGMAGPDKSISAVMPCTVIAPLDMADNLLDRSKHPLWRGERTSMLESMPADLAAWDISWSCTGSTRYGSRPTSAPRRPTTSFTSRS